MKHVRTGLLVTVALAALIAGVGCGSNEKAEEFDDVTLEEVDDKELVAAAQAQVSDPGSEISDDLTQDVEMIADDCGVEFDAP